MTNSESGTHVDAIVTPATVRATATVPHPEVRTVSTSWNPETQLVSIAEGFVIPSPYAVSVDGGALPYRLEMEVVVEGGRLACRALRLERRAGGLALTGENLRVPVARLIAETARPVARRVAKGHRGKPMPIGDEDIAEFHVAVQRAQGRGRQPVTDERLRKVAELYRAGLASGAPKQSVCLGLDPPITTAQAGRLIMRARERGFLGPSPGPGKAGEK